MKRLCSFFLVAGLILAAFSLAAESGNEPVYSITLSDEVITPVTAEYISKAIQKAEEDDASLLIINLDTPGGLLTSTRKIVKEMMASDVPIAVYVSPEGARAGSAGVFITLAANIAAMAPSTNIGAAHPVTVGGDGGGFEKAIKGLKKRFKDSGKPAEKQEKIESPMEDKVLNDTIAWVKGIAEVRGRNVRWAVKAVTESSSISAKEALKKGVIDLIAKNEKDLIEKIDGMTIRLKDGKAVLNLKGSKTTELPMSLRQKILSILASPNIAYILLMLGFYGLLFEFTHPGIGFPGIAGVISIVVGFYGLHVLDANYAGVALIILAIILFIMEVKVVSYGLLTLGGITSLVLGSLMLFDSPDEFMRVSIPVVLSFTLTTFVLVIFLVTMVVRTHKRKVSTGYEGLIGSSGEVVKWRGGKGKIFVHGELWNAVSDEDFDKGDSVEIVSVKGMRLSVIGDR